MSKRAPTAPSSRPGSPWAISDRTTAQEISADYAMHPIQVSQWKEQLLGGASELLTRGKKSKENNAGQASEAELVQQYCFAEA